MSDSNPPKTSETAKSPRPKPATKSTKAARSTRRRSKRFVRSLIVAGILILVGVGGTLAAQDWLDSRSLTERTGLKDDGNSLQTVEETTVSSVVDKTADSIVSIVTAVPTSNPFYGYSLQEGAGTGMVVGSDGYILTNKHVIDNARQVQVVRGDGTTYDNVKVIATDPLNDLAFLKIPDVKDLPVVDLGDSTTVRIGQRVIAIGNSLGQYQNTVTSGIISGTGRPIAAQAGQSVETLTDLLQTDAAINPGNSGGPLLNLAGQVIGVNTAIAADAEGIGFAIPINAAKGLLKQILAGDKQPKRAYLGVIYQPVNAAMAKRYDLAVKEGAYIMSGDPRQASVMSGSPAEKAGLKEGDVITKVNDIPVGTRGGVSSLIAEYAPGDTIELTYQRGDKQHVTKVTLGAYKDR